MLTPQLFDGDKIVANSNLFKKLGRLYILKIKDWYVRRFEEYNKSGLCNNFEIFIHDDKIIFKYQAEGKLHEDINRSLRLDFLVP